MISGHSPPSSASSSSGAAPRMKAPLLGQAAVLAALLVLGSCLAGFQHCPRSLDCARAGREFCPPGGSRCGPCLRPLVENSGGRCVVHRRHAAPPSTEEVRSSPELDEDIDFLSAVISEQRTETQLPVTEEPEQPGSAHSTPPTERIINQSRAPPTATALLSNAVLRPRPSNDQAFIALSSVLMAAGSLALLAAAACWLRLQKGARLTQKVDYSAYGPMKTQTLDNTPGDRTLAHSAQMFHYQHQKQQMLCLDKHSDEPKVLDSGASSDEENEDGDFTVYECPGLAPTGEMEVKNPLFDDSTLYLKRFHQ